MTQDQYGQSRDSGYVHGQVVEDDETGEFENDQDRPMTRFQKVASALRGDRPDHTAEDEVPADQEGTVTPAAPDPNGAALDSTASDDTLPDSTLPDGTVPGQAVRPDVPTNDYWDVPGPRGTSQGQADMTQPDLPPVTDAGTDPLAAQDEMADRDEVTGRHAAGAQDYPATQPDTFGNGVRPDTADTAAASTVTPDTAVPDTAVPDTAVPDTTAVGTQAVGTPAASVPEDLHPGEATGTLDDLGDLAYGKLIPDAADFNAQWREIQFKFVDDPHASVTEAAEIVEQVTTKMEAAIQERQRAIQERQRLIAERQQAIQDQQSSLRGRWGEEAQADTETLRETLRMYKAFLDQLVGPKA